MGNKNSKEPQPGEQCPRHPEQTLTHVCTHTSCIEPLCSICLSRHQEQHTSIGTQPNLHTIPELSKTLHTSHQQDAKIYTSFNQFSEPVRRLSTSQTIKELTRQYFLAKRSNQGSEIKIKELLNNLQMAQILKQSSNQESIRSFLKVHLKVNEDVVDEEFRPLY